MLCVKSQTDQSFANKGLDFCTIWSWNGPWQPVFLQTRKLRPREIKVVPSGNYGYLGVEIRLKSRI